MDFRTGVRFPSAPYRGVAQFGRALRSGRRSRRFESCHLDFLIFLRKRERGIRFIGYTFCFIGKCAYKTKSSVNATLKSHCGGKVDVAKATHRRRRISQARFFLIY